MRIPNGEKNQSKEDANLPVVTMKKLWFLKEIVKQEPARLAESLMEIHDEMVYFSSWDIMDREKKWLLDLKRVVEALGVLGDEVIKCLRALYFYMFLTI